MNHSHSDSQTTDEPRILVVVLSLDREPWRTLEGAQRETWLQPNETFEVLHVRGITRSFGRSLFLAARKLLQQVGLQRFLDRLYGRILVRLPVTTELGILKTKTYEYWIGTSVKTHASLKHISHNHKFDYLVRTNSSTYVHLPRLIEHLRTAPRTGYYAGADRGEAHAQGTLIILSQDLVSILAEARQWEYETVEDKALGTAARQAGYPLQGLNQTVVDQTIEDIRSVPPASGATDFIFRLKDRGDRLGDADRMKALHAAFVEFEKQGERGDS